MGIIALLHREVVQRLPATLTSPKRQISPPISKLMSSAIAADLELSPEEAARDAEVARITRRLCDAIHRETSAIVGVDRTMEFSLVTLDDPELLRLDDELSNLRQRYVRAEIARDELVAGCTKMLEAWKEAARKFVQQEQKPEKARRARRK